MTSTWRCTTSCTTWRVAADCEPRFEIISGYRSPESNAKMAAAGQWRREEVAAHAGPRHRRAPARIAPAPTCATWRWRRRRAEWATTERSDFVHIDTGRFRTWAG